MTEQTLTSFLHYTPVHPVISHYFIMSKRCRTWGIDLVGDVRKLARILDASKVCYILEHTVEDTRTVIWNMLPTYSARVRIGRVCKQLHEEIAKITARDTGRLNWDASCGPPPPRPRCLYLGMEPFVDALVSTCSDLPVQVCSWVIYSGGNFWCYIYRAVIESSVSRTPIVVEFSASPAGFDQSYGVSLYNHMLYPVPPLAVPTLDDFLPILSFYFGWLCRPMTGHPFRLPARLRVG